MILKIPADVVVLNKNWDIEGSKILYGTNTGELQDLWSSNASSGENDLLSGLHLERCGN